MDNRLNGLELIIKEELRIGKEDCPLEFVSENNGHFVRYAIYSIFGIVPVILFIEKIDFNNIEISAKTIVNILLSGFLHMLGENNNGTEDQRIN